MTPAVRIRKRGQKGADRYTVHWLLDPGRTYCGLHVDELDVAEELELERLPAVEECRGCVRFAEGWVPARPSEGGARGATLPPSTGRLRTTGSLSHGFRARGGRRLA